MNQASYERFSRSVHNFYADQRVPLDVAIEVTHRCPLACVHCYNNLPLGDGASQDRELSAKEHFRILDELAELGCVWLLFTGGEIFARPDFLEIYGYAKSKGFLITLFTNAILIDEKIADFLAEQPPFVVEVTIYGRTKQVYEAITGRAGTYERCYRAIEMLRQRGVPLRLKTVVTALNQIEVAPMREFAEQNAGSGFKFDSLINARTDCSHGPLAVRLSAEQVVATDVASVEVMPEYAALLEAEAKKPREAATTVYRCGAGMKSFAIDPCGGMSLCVLSKRDVYDVRKGSVGEGWERFLKAVRERQVTKATRCDRCSLASICGMCPAHGELENEDPEKPVEFLCEVAHLRALVLGIEPAPHGDCPYCGAGERHDEISRKARRAQVGAKEETMTHTTGGCVARGCFDCSGSFNRSAE